MGTTLLTARAVSKSFGNIRVLDHAQFDLRAGEVHALLGHNGSGKSTFIKVLAGVHKPESGARIEVGATPLPAGSPREAQKRGMRFVHQRPALIGEMDAADNFALGRGYAKRWGCFIDWRAQERETCAALERSGGDGTSRRGTELRDQAPIDRSRLAISRALAEIPEGGILILDEPTASLSPGEVGDLFQSVRRATDSGVGVIYITHRLREVYDLADRITLLREGRTIGTYDKDEIDVESLVEALVGVDVSDTASPTMRSSLTPSSSGHSVASTTEEACALSVRDLTSEVLSNVTFQLAPGEILAVCGVDGSGRETFATAITGAGVVDSLTLATKRGEASLPSLRAARDLGVGLAQESRAAGALVNEFSVSENLSLPYMEQFRSRGILNRSRQERHAKEWIDRLNILPDDPQAILSTMSGGNRQKVVIARALAGQPDVLVLDEPTAGVDVGASGILHSLFRQLAGGRLAVLLVSSDLDEVLALADRTLVLDRGAIVAEMSGTDLSEESLLRAMS
ncbi:MAG TPA: sugar ABC transporter ATP-binding protein [Nocardioidaceae bacterium]|nr:sugar ABC transporter ATP-binding protein [Nocardioidaceae bacterium]